MSLINSGSGLAFEAGAALENQGITCKGDAGCPKEGIRAVTQKNCPAAAS